MEEHPEDKYHRSLRGLHLQLRVLTLQLPAANDPTYREHLAQRFSDLLLDATRAAKGVRSSEGRERDAEYYQSIGGAQKQAMEITTEWVAKVQNKLNLHSFAGETDNDDKRQSDSLPSSVPSSRPSC